MKWFGWVLLIAIGGLSLLVGVYGIHRAIETPAERAAEDKADADAQAARDRAEQKAEADKQAAQAKADTEEKASQLEELRHDQYSMKALAERIVSPRLRDPDSAEYSSLRMDRSGTYLCGWVNSKNGFGGYNGPTPFVASTSMVILDDGTRSFQKFWALCDA